MRAHASGALAEFGKWTRRNRLAAASLAAVIVGSVSVALWMTRSNDELRSARADADAGREYARESERNARMIAAASAADSGELLMAQRMLDETPEKVRDWEWRHLALRVDSSERILADLGSSVLAAQLLLNPPALVVAVSAPAVDGRANDAVVQALADALKVRRAEIAIVSGHTARSKVVDIDLDVEAEQVRLDVADNGVGIAESDLNGRKSLGLLGMHERALLFGGEVNISGAPGHGTRVSVIIPTRNRS